MPTQTSRKLRKTSYDKIRELIQICPNGPYLKTALKHFSDAALLRELQRRNALPPSKSTGHFTSAALVAECAERDMCVASLSELKQAIDNKDWSVIEAIYWRDDC